jgi:hypothetical protein
MIRFAVALCVLLVVPRVASSRPALSDDFERPQAHRHAINAVIGDLSFILEYGVLPPPGTDPDVRVRTHLEFVHKLLARRDVSHFPARLREAREKNLDGLREYIDAGEFPRNYLYSDQNRPCFIDRDGRVCAAGYLVEHSAGREVAEQINDEFQSEFLWRMSLPLIDQWVAASGLSVVELCMIQPTYAPEFRVDVTQDSDLAPATVSIVGDVREFSCPTRTVMFDFGDGTLWTSPTSVSYIVPIDVSHVYTTPGEYTITGLAMGALQCEGLWATETWTITLSPPNFTLIAISVPGGPPYAVYLTTTDDIRMDYMTAATVEWEEGAPAEAADWYADDGAYRTPTHAYTQGGQRTIDVTHCYGEAPCTYRVVSSVAVVPGAVPTESSTWGRIKALYAFQN